MNKESQGKIKTLFNVPKNNNQILNVWDSKLNKELKNSKFMGDKILFTRVNLSPLEKTKNIQT